MSDNNIKIIEPVGCVRGQITLPGDKSMSHRALMFAAIAKGVSKIRHLNIGADALSTIACLQKLGVNFQLGKFTVDVDSPGINAWTQPQDGILNCGNSGTTVRLMSGLLAGRENLNVIITGDDSLSIRPMKRVIEPLKKMGADICAEDGHLPMKINGKMLNGIQYLLPVASAQVKSCVLFAGLSAQGKTFVEETIKSRDHTERMMKMFHIPVFHNKNIISVHTLRRSIPGFNYSVPGDPSSAAYWIAAGLLLPKSRLLLKKMSINPTRTAFISLLKASGAGIDLISNDKNLEPMGDVLVCSSTLRKFDIRAKQVPGLIDELPLLALIATQAKGLTTIRGAKELRYKESDRISSTVAMLKNIGAEVKEFNDGMNIIGGLKLRGGKVDARGDHRIAMTASIAGLITEEPVYVSGWSTVNISYPNFYNILDRISKK
ncbi:MAG: 3-phosphoshikimate 1-carboxyvinyltransferase [Candidatus Marinimicrobia bacterium]|nr:3-phosphoshikimate 1-carboxyvinyltransferase [Candidatus Neomarinimicrobiota bacterium]